MDFIGSDQTFTIIVAVATLAAFWAAWMAVAWQPPVEARLKALRTRRVKTRSSQDAANKPSPKAASIGVMRESYGKKIPIPGELSVIGFDNIHLAQYILPPLTTIEMSQAQLGRLAFQALLSDVRREVPDPKGSEYVLKTSFVLRDSTAMNSQKRFSKVRLIESGV